MVEAPGREAAVGAEFQHSQPPPRAFKAAGMAARLDDGGDERRKARGGPAGLLKPFGMDEVQSLEGVLAFDGTVHVNAAFDASVALNERARIDDLELVAVFENFDVFVRGDRVKRHDR